MVYTVLFVGKTNQSWFLKEKNIHFYFVFLSCVIVLTATHEIERSGNTKRNVLNLSSFDLLNSKFKNELELQCKFCFGHETQQAHAHTKI